MDVNYRSTSGCFLFPYESGRACHPERRRREGSAFPQMRRTCLREGSGGGIVFIGLFGILFVVGAALGIVAFMRLREVDQNDLVRIPDLLRRVAELERRLGIGEEAKPLA